MGSSQYRVKVRRISGNVVDLELRLLGDLDAVYDEPLFAARLLADSLDEEGIRVLFPEADPEQPFGFASDWLEENHLEVIDPSSLRIFDGHNHPRDSPSLHQLVSALAAPRAALWATAPLQVVTEVAALAKATGGALEFEADPEVYLAGSLEELVEEIASLELERLARLESKACLTIGFRHHRWHAHLRAGDEFDSVAYP